MFIRGLRSLLCRGGYCVCISLFIFYAFSVQKTPPHEEKTGTEQKPIKENTSPYQEKIGTHQRPIKVAIVPSVQASKSMVNMKPFVKCLEEETGLFFEFSSPSSYIAVVEALGAKKVDLAYPEIISALLAIKKYGDIPGVAPLLKVGHFGRSHYYSVIIARNNGSVNKVEDLNRKKFGFSDKSSASSYIMPMILMKKLKMAFSHEFSAGSMEASIMALLQKKVDAVGGYYDPPMKEGGIANDPRHRLEKTYPNIMQETKIIWTSESIPNEPIMARKDIDPTIKKSLIKSLKSCTLKYPRLINNIDALYDIGETDKDYDKFLNLVLSSGLDIANILKK